MFNEIIHEHYKTTLKSNNLYMYVMKMAHTV